MRRLLGVLAVGIVWLWFAAAPAFATYPAAWPDGGSPGSPPTNPDSGWTPYTYGGQVIFDPAGGSPGDPSNGGTQPNGVVDVVSESGTRPSAYYHYDPTNQVVFFRLRLQSDPFTDKSGQQGNGSGYPLSSGQWNILIDTTGSGYRTYIVALNGSSNTAPDHIEIYQGTPTSNSAAIPMINSYPTVTVALPANLQTGANDSGEFDLGATRTIYKPNGAPNSIYLDWQIPLSAFGGGITASTRIAFGWATSDAAQFNNPFQKDIVFNGAFQPADQTVKFAFGDALTLGGGLISGPVVLSVDSGCTGGTNRSTSKTLTATVLDTLTVVNNSVVPSVTSVKFYYMPAGGNAATQSTLIGTVTTPVAGTTNQYQITWNNTGAPVDGTYNIYAVATDSFGFSNPLPTNANTSIDTCTFGGGVTAPQLNVSGYVYSDADHNAQRASTEGGTGVSGLYVKLIASGGSSAAAAAAVDATTGAYSFSGVTGNASYTLIVDDNNTLSDITSAVPSGWIGTENPTQSLSLTLTTNDVTFQDFGLFHGSKLSGTLFRDDGSGGGTANNGIKDGGESGVGNDLVALKDAGGTTTYDQALTAGDGTFTLWIPNAAGAGTLTVVPTLPSGSAWSGGSGGTTGGTFSTTTGILTFTYAPATASYTGVQFGEVGIVTFLQDNTLSGQPGSTVFFPHRFQAASAGSVTFTVTHTADPTATGFSNVLFQDSNGNGALDSGEPQITGPLAVTAGQELYLLVKDFIPTNASQGARDTVLITATYTYGGSSLQVAITHTDVVTVGSSAAIALSKAVDKTTALSGDNITYTITYTNSTGQTISNLVVHDSTPAYTTFVSATNGTLPTGLTGCTVASPSVGATGVITWTFTGTLPTGGSGTVTFVVKVK